MDSNDTYAKTNRGIRAIIKKLPRDAGLVLSQIDGTLTASEVHAKTSKLNEENFQNAITWLIEGGFIKLIVIDPFSDSVWADAALHDAVEVDEIGLDQFTVSVDEPTHKTKPIHPKKQLSDEDKAKIAALKQADIEARERAEASLKATNKAEKSEQQQIKAEQAAKEKAEREAAEKAEEEARKAAELEAQEKAKKEAEQAAKEKAEREAAEKAERQAIAKAEAEAKAQAKKEEKERIAAEKKAENDRKAKEKAEKKEAAKLAAAAKKEEKAKAKAEKKEAARIAAAEKAQQKEQTKATEFSETETLSEDEIEQYLTDEDEPKRTTNFLKLAKQGFSRTFKGIKLLSVYAVVIAVLLVFAIQFINIRPWISKVEHLAEQKIQAPVDVRAVKISFFPRPHLLIEELSLENSQTITAEKVHVYPDLSQLKEKLLGKKGGLQSASNPPYDIKTVHIENFSITQKDLPSLAKWKAAFAQDQQLNVDKLSFDQMVLILNETKLQSLNGEVAFNATGALKSAIINTENKSLTATISTNNNQYLIKLSGTNWRVPLSPYPVFKKLNASGALKDNQLTFSSINGHLYNGIVGGKLNIDLASEILASTGEFTLKNLLIANMNEALKLESIIDGKLNSSGKVAFNINKLSNNITNGKLNSTFSISNGHLKTVDITGAMRSGNLSGNTSFDKLTGNASLANQTYRFNNLLLRDKQMSARGRVTLSPENKVSGAISVSIAVKRNPINARLKINGPLTALKLSK